MTLRLLLFSTLFGLIVATDNFQTIAAPTPPKSCSPPALSRFARHKVAPGETLEEVAAKYNLIPATLIGTNPALQNGQVFVGSEIAIPPYNGIRVQVPRGQTWKQLAAKYKVRADVLFEVNGCQSVPQVVFIPGVNWSPKPVVSDSKQIIQGYPLSQQATIALSYGWQVDAATGKVVFHSGIDLLAPAGTPVKVVNNGIVAFAGDGASYGNLVVVNHSGGKQTRYAHLQSIAVRAGNQVKQGDLLGKVGTTGKPSSLQVHLHFELRYASKLGWTAEDPTSGVVNPPQVVDN
ncbi:MAG: M23 family metallopeptidase [Chroococcus sp. CMT-3BRIN-NPC107]|jgi:murein DD-endopeptidase MepM/ murein hydrolase activator NlpD|nr:M23 family metallopeptidase [Chroococcus sp. CMT-3BRIN-NPC107]